MAEKMDVEYNQFETCDNHRRIISLYCNEANCKIPICSLCMLNDHQNHDIKDVWEAEVRSSNQERKLSGVQRDPPERN